MIVDADDDNLPVKLRVVDQMGRKDHAALPVHGGLGGPAEDVSPQPPRVFAERIQRGHSRLDGSSPILTTVGLDTSVEPAREDRPVGEGRTEPGGKSEAMLVIDRVLVLTDEQQLSFHFEPLCPTLPHMSTRLNHLAPPRIRVAVVQPRSAERSCRSYGPRPVTT